MSSNSGTYDDPRVLEALQLFSEVENTQISDPRDEARFEALVGGGGKVTAASRPPPASRAATATTSTTSKTTKATALKSQVQSSRENQVNEVVLQQLHKKNKELQTEIEHLRRQVISGGGKPTTSSPISSPSKSEELRKLQDRIHAKDSEIEALKATRNTSAPPTHNNAGGTIGANLVLSRSSPTPVAPVVVSREKQAYQQQQTALLQVEHSKLKRQLEELQGIKVEYITQGEATGKVNKEVKDFFLSMRKKLQEDSVSREAERLSMNERIFELEMQLSSK